MRTVGMGPADVVWLGRGVGAGSLIILAGVLVHRATRPQRQSVFRVVVAGRWGVIDLLERNHTGL